ncbi:lef-2 [Erannis ankeraria nucleopolyhedrovirus]|uniref:lef-2 n=1 Tax=Erannis ankeraria nucleopolyhedrovirus TaxID=2913600 RepID=UPI002481AB92|nr:lef-2 [Erannis ankeraria nucleopolyhedrovirus]UJZ88983.1 lef-2 [Erannis ankeraria nucleopolyhedrovirus]
METDTNQILLWDASITSQTVNKDNDYMITIEDINFNIEIGPYTRFVQNGQCILISGKRLFYLLKQDNIKPGMIAADVSNIKYKKKSCKNVCFKSVLLNKNSVIGLIKKKLNIPPCIDNLLGQIKLSPRGNRFSKRFVLNCYVANLLTCVKCNKNCLMAAMNILYDNDAKCVREFESLLTKNEDIYKPPNCVNMKKNQMCYMSQLCKGSNPLCNC